MTARWRARICAQVHPPPAFPPRRRALLGAAAACWPALALLQACSTVPADSASAPWTQGRLLLRVDATPSQTAQSFSAAFELRGSGTSGELRLLSPLGTRLATALWSPRQVLLTTPEGERTFENLDDLSQQALGQPVPLAALPDWLAGRPWAGAPFTPQPGGFEQLGWQVQTAAHADGLLEARRPAAPTAPAVLLRVKLELPT